MITVTLTPVGTTGTGLKTARNFEDATRMAIEFDVEAVGATPSVTYQIKGCPPGKDATVAGNYVKIAYVTEDSTIAVSTADLVLTAAGEKVVYLDGLASRFFSALAVDVTANTNITYSARVHRADRA